MHLECSRTFFWLSTLPFVVSSAQSLVSDGSLLRMKHKRLALDALTSKVSGDQSPATTNPLDGVSSVNPTFTSPLPSVSISIPSLDSSVPSLTSLLPLPDTSSSTSPGPTLATTVSTSTSISTDTSQATTSSTTTSTTSFI